MLENVLLGLGDVFNFTSLLFMFFGVTCGIIVGAIPGLSGPIAIALCIPLTYYMSPVAAIGFLVGINKGGTFGGSIASILLNTPGSPESSATCYDGYPMALQGKGEKALKISLFSSFFGDTISAISLIVLSIPLAAVALKLSPPDLCAIMVFSLILVSGLDSSSVGKSIIAAAMGMLLSTVGMDTFGDERLTFNNLTLSAGIPLMSVAIGTLALSELVFQMQKQFLGQKSGAEASCGADKDACRLPVSEMLPLLPTAIRSSIIGVIIGVLPGLGSTMAAFMAYGTAKKASKHPEQFGKGCPEGISAPEAANNAIIGANLVPLLTPGHSRQRVRRHHHGCPHPARPHPRPAHVRGTSPHHLRHLLRRAHGGLHEPVLRLVRPSHLHPCAGLPPYAALPRGHVHLHGGRLPCRQLHLLHARDAGARRAGLLHEKVRLQLRHLPHRLRARAGI